MLLFVILHSKRCLEYLILQFPTLRKKGCEKARALGSFNQRLAASCSRLAPSWAPAQGSCPLAQGLHSRALGIYVVICHFTFKKVSRIPHWWLVRVTIVVNWLFLPQNSGPVVGTYEAASDKVSSPPRSTIPTPSAFTEQQKALVGFATL